MSKLGICRICGTDILCKTNRKDECTPCNKRKHYDACRKRPAWRVGQLLSAAKNRATTKGLDFDLDRKYIQKLWDDQSGTCLLTGQPFVLVTGEGTNPYAPSLDRVIPELGYTRGNVRLICFQMNMAINEFGLEQFETLMRQYQANGGLG